VNAGFEWVSLGVAESLFYDVQSVILAIVSHCLLWMQELLVATRHVLATDFRRGFFSQIDTLLDERYVSFYF
jgi:transformation/transcription domain-associated protein